MIFVVMLQTLDELDEGKVIGDHGEQVKWNLISEGISWRLNSVNVIGFYVK